MKLQTLKYFTVLAEELHFGRAARRLAITQPPLSTAIKALEEELGVVLLLRDKTRVELTAAGGVFLDEARKILEGVTRATNLVKSVDHGIVGRLDVGFGGTLIYRDVLQIVAAFRAESPGIEVVLHEMQSSDQFDKLLRTQLDAGFAHGSAPPQRLKALALIEDAYVLCVPAGHPLANQAKVRLKDLGNEEFVMFERDTNPVNHDTVMSMFSRAGLYPKVIHYARNWMTTVGMVSEGCGVTVVPGSLARMRMAGVRLVPFAGPRMPAPGMLVWNPAVDHPARERFLDSAQRTITRLKRRQR